MEVYTTMTDYGGKVSDEITEAVNERGGLDILLKRIAQNSVVPNEIRRITKEIYALNSKAMDVEFVKTLLTSNILTRPELDKLIEQKFAKAQAISNNRTINSKTIIGSIAGIVAGSVVVGVLWAASIIYFGQMIFPFIIPVYIFCYLIIKFFTKQSRSNVVVFVAAFLATILALLIGFYFVYLMEGNIFSTK